MFSKRSTPKSTGSYWDNIQRLRQALDWADAVVVGAGAGLSASAGFDYGGRRFQQYFGDFQRKYGFSDMYTGGFYPYRTPEETWAYWSRYIWINRYQDPPKPVYRDLRKLLEGKDYFVLTTNVNHCFQKAGFEKHRLFYTQGDYGLFQCSEPCRQLTWDNEQAVRHMVERQQGMRVPSELVPRCPYCGRPAAMNLRADDTFVQDQGWHEARRRYQQFLQRYSGGAVLCLELGVGGNTPGIIKYPFWRYTRDNPKALYACVNLGQSFAPSQLADRALCLDGDIGQTLADLA